MPIPHYISENYAPLLVCAGSPSMMLENDTFRSNVNNPFGNYIVSKNKTAIARLEKDGNFVIYTGLFGNQGQAIGKTVKIWDLKSLPTSKDFYSKVNSPVLMTLTNGLTVYTYGGTNKLQVFKPPFEPGTEILEITDSGNLIYTVNGIPKWSLFPPNQKFTTSSSANNIMDSTMSTNYVLPIAAALAGLYFFLK
jgi:hypothetical protein